MKYDERMEVVERRSYMVVKANEIVQRARHDLSLKELKLLNYCISLVRPNDQPNKQYEMTIKQYCQVRGIDEKNGKNYEMVKKTLKALRDKSFWLQKENGAEVTVGWLGKVEINRGSGRILFKFDEDLSQYITGLLGQYTQFELLGTLPMASVHSIRLYELLKSYSFNHCEMNFELDELKKRTGSENLYTDFRNYRRKVIDVAVREINLYTDLELAYETVKTGKSVTGITFYIKHKNLDERIAAYENAEMKLDDKHISEQIPGQMNIYDYL